MEPPEPKPKQPSLALHLGIVLLLKFALLALLWYLLVMPYRVEIDAPAMGQRRTSQRAGQSITSSCGPCHIPQGIVTRMAASLR